MSAGDLELLKDFVYAGSQDAFAELVRRHLDLVYSTALRQVRSPELAQEISQSVFTDLARNASNLKPGTILTAWLYQVARRTAVDIIRRESRRQARERLAVEIAAMNASVDWTQMEPLLEEAMDSLEERDRAAKRLGVVMAGENDFQTGVSQLGAHGGPVINQPIGEKLVPTRTWFSSSPYLVMSPGTRTKLTWLSTRLWSAESRIASLSTRSFGSLSRYASQSEPVVPRRASKK